VRLLLVGDQVIGEETIEEEKFCAKYEGLVHADH
jgi:hypothetical protein